MSGLQQNALKHQISFLQIVNLLASDDYGEREIGILLIKQLCSRQQNALLFINLGVVTKLVQFIDARSVQCHVDSAARALAQVRQPDRCTCCNQMTFVCLLFANTIVTFSVHSLLAFVRCFHMRRYSVTGMTSCDSKALRLCWRTCVQTAHFLSATHAHL